MDIIAGNNCFFACMHNLLIKQNIHVTENELFFCGRGLDLYHARSDLNDNMAFIPYNEIIKSLGNIYGFYANTLELPNIEAFYEHLKTNSIMDHFLLAFMKYDLGNKKQVNRDMQLHSVLLKNNKHDITMIDPYHISARGIPEVYIEQCRPEDIFEKCEQLISICVVPTHKKPDVKEYVRKQLTSFFTDESEGIALLLLYIRTIAKSINLYDDVESLLYSVRIRFMCVFPYLENFIKERVLHSEKQTSLFLFQWKALKGTWEELIIILIRLSCKVTDRTIEKLDLICSKLEIGHKNLLMHELIKLTFL
jgi:hypothetical protein